MPTSGSFPAARKCLITNGSEGRVPSCPSTFLFSASSAKKKVQYYKKIDINMFGGFGKNQFVLVLDYCYQKSKTSLRVMCVT